MATVVPVARALTLCDHHVGYSDGKVDLYGLFNAIRSRSGYPYTRARFCVFAQLTDGLGRVPMFLDIRHVGTDAGVWTSGPRELEFPSRTTVVQFVMAIEGVQFDRPGRHVIELHCNGVWVCDAPFLLH